MVLAMSDGMTRYFRQKYQLDNVATLGHAINYNSLPRKNKIFKNSKQILIGITGTLLGLLIGLVLTYFLGPVIAFIENLLGMRFLEVYFINYFPVDLRVNWILAICLISILLTILASLYPSRLASKINPAEVLRYE